MTIPLQSWLKLNQGHEGRCYWMYEDIKGFMTTGVGNLLPLSLAVQLPWKRKDGSIASETEIRAEFHRLKALKGELNGGFWYKQHATLFLNDEDVDGLVERKLRSMEAYVHLRLPSFSSWPLDSQCGLMSMCWAMGEAKPFNGSYPKFLAHARRGNFAEFKLVEDKVELVSGCASECGISTGVKGTPSYNPGVAPRNQMNRILFANGYHVSMAGLDKSILYYPANLTGVGEKR